MEVASAKLVNRDEITGAALSTFAGDSTDIPESYIRTDEVLAAEVVGEDEAYELPVVDMAKLLDPDSSAMETEKLGYACRHWGFFQLMNHGVDEAAAQLIKDSAVQFFSLPLDIKNRVAVPEKGAGIEGYGHHYSRGRGDKLDWAEGLILITQPVQERNMNLWPTNPPEFRSVSCSVHSGFMSFPLGV
ncbi:hypothetical protein PVAP13_9NG505400 [Panicum virgatum]|uniref:Non-haem dioxygenase N-terminal domain-containing protein n=1 Tax=Panicum virgatum TaxID=38727 RepID=A0A8T0MTM7_PANVG|nr:hypothetical protein PVAP13_9NG505400 [Panicum virgatum]